MEKFCLVLLVLSIFAVLEQTKGRPALEPEAPPYQIDVRPDGYAFSYKTDDHAHEENGILDKAAGEEGAMRVKGSYNFVAPNGNVYEVVFEADENGFRPKFTGGAKSG